MAKYPALPRALLEALVKDYFQKKKSISLPRALLEALDKDYFQKKIYLFAGSPPRSSRQRLFSKKYISLCRELGQAALGKAAVSRNGYFSLPRAGFWLSAARG